MDNKYESKSNGAKLENGYIIKFPPPKVNTIYNKD